MRKSAAAREATLPEGDVTQVQAVHVTPAQAVHSTTVLVALYMMAPEGPAMMVREGGATMDLEET